MSGFLPPDPGLDEGPRDGLRASETDPAEHGVAGLSTDWSVPWSDLMMVLFILFVVLYCYETTERRIHDAFRESDPLAAHNASLPLVQEPSFEPRTGRGILEESREWVRGSDLEDVEVVLQSDESVKLSVHGPTYFDLGSAELRPKTRVFLRGLSRILRRNPYEVEVVGHTDTFPIHGERYPTNWELSTARAARVARYLIEQGGLDPARFTLVGHSMYRPAVPNTSLRNKSLNRRVEIVITRRPYRPAGQE